MNKKLLKTITWRITASSTTLLIVFLISGQLKIAGSVAALEIIGKTIIYYLHESAWEQINLAGDS